MLGDTIFAVASPHGPAVRGILRLSGPAALALAGELLQVELPRQRAVVQGSLPVLGFHVACMALVFVAPASYTGEDVVELHLPGSPLLLAHVQTRLRVKARDATPGEFTRRAFEHGKLDLTQAEAVLELIHASSEHERRDAVVKLSGGLRQATDHAKGRVQDALALLEAGLDFTAEETGAVERALWLPSLEAAHAALAQLSSGVPQATLGGELLLLGAANAGKSSLCNALNPAAALLVSDIPGTTRDLIAVEIAPGTILFDAPGDLADAAGIDAQALAARDALASRCRGALLVLDLTRPQVVPSPLPVVAVVFNKSDLTADTPDLPLPEVPRFVVSAKTGAGLDALRAFLQRQAAAGVTVGRRRVGDHLERARQGVAMAMRRAKEGAPEETIAADLAAVLAELDQIHGRSSPEDLLDRIFAGFCLGK